MTELPGEGTPTVEPTRDRTRTLTGKRELFVREYLIDMNAAGAYRRAGYEAANDQVAASCAHKLLRNAEVRAAIDAAQCERLGRLDLDADWVLVRLKLVYLTAMHNAAYAQALKALELLGKHLGVFEKDNRQRAADRTDDLEALKAELRRRGYDVDANPARPARPGSVGPSFPHRPGYSLPVGVDPVA